MRLELRTGGGHRGGAGPRARRPAPHPHVPFALYRFLPSSSGAGRWRLAVAFLSLSYWDPGLGGMAAAAAEGQASDDSEEEEGEEEDVGFLEYDSTWEDEGEEDGEPREEDRGRKGLEAATKEKAKAHEKQGWWSPGATWASGSQVRVRVVCPPPIPSSSSPGAPAFLGGGEERRRGGIRSLPGVSSLGSLVCA